MSDIEMTDEEKLFAARRMKAAEEYDEIVKMIRAGTLPKKGMWCYVKWEIIDGSVFVRFTHWLLYPGNPEGEWTGPILAC